MKLPRYCRLKSLKNGRRGYFFEPPTWARKEGCPVTAEALGEDYATALNRTKNILLPAFDSWRSGGLTDMVPASPVPGTFDWLVAVFKANHRWREIDFKTQRLYDQGLALFANHELNDGSRAGSKQIADFSKAFVDAVYANLLVVQYKDADGNIVKRERRRFANAAMTACRRAWFVGQRAQETKVPAINPFSRMGLKSRAPGQAVRETPTATWEELVAFRHAAKRLGYHSIATAALLTWEWLQREEHIFGVFEIEHYRPKERPNSVRIMHPKNGEEAWWPLVDENSVLLFPELMAELDALKDSVASGRAFRRDHAHRRSPTPLPWITERKDLRYLRHVVKKIIIAAGLRNELSFTSFRHGGFTEGADSDLTDAELRAAGRHRSRLQLPTYAKRTRKQLIVAAKKRREERARTTLLSEGVLAPHSSVVSSNRHA
ncbi:MULTISPECIES: hypothetical protein [Bradyrhizobium]|uniref:hypothetical protein n=1 Tax=Bradyrhizobium TaxID=374 RepID=UPI001CE25F86|nr:MULTISPECIES: hypothetical protein [Bradyrhizobium]MCA6102093.1 hypothetical protein [Bradyrhizobium australafricanum]MCC8972837.1 hypothetical protein [Bradyrhizobium brasilense]